MTKQTQIRERCEEDGVFPKEKAQPKLRFFPFYSHHKGENKFDCASGREPNPMSRYGPCPANIVAALPLDKTSCAVEFQTNPMPRYGPCTANIVALHSPSTKLATPWSFRPIRCLATDRVLPILSLRSPSTKLAAPWSFRPIRCLATD